MACPSVSVGSSPVTSRPPSNVVQQALIDIGVGTTPANPATSAVWPVYVGDEPDLPDNVITIYDTAGVLHGREMNESEMLGMQGLQFRVRARTYPLGYEKISALAQEADLLYFRTVTIGAQTYLIHDIKRVSDPFQLPAPGKKENVVRSERYVFIFNALISMIREV